MHFVPQSKADRWTTRQASPREFVVHDGNIMLIDPSHPVVALCVAGMEVDGTPEAALELFMKAWDARTDDYDASIAAHFVARHQPNVAARLHWNRTAVMHAIKAGEAERASLMASLYLNLADSLLENDLVHEAREAVDEAASWLPGAGSGGYGQFVARGIKRFEQRLTVLGA